MTRILGVLAVLAVGALLFAKPTDRLRAGHTYRATFDAPPAARDSLAHLVGLFPPGADVTVNDRNQVVAVFVAVKDADLDDPSTPLAGDIQTPIGPLVLRRLQEIS